MTTDPILVTVGDAPEIESYLAQRIYEFNAEATGYFDGEYFSASRRDDSGTIRAGVFGYTWGGCCYVTYLWVDASERRHGHGTALLDAAENHAKAKDCKVVFLATHSFQAPDFYRRRGYKRKAYVQNHPVGHASMVFAKRLRDDGSA